MSDHLRDDFDADEVFAVVDGDSKVDHFRENDHVTAVGSHNDIFTLLLRLPCSSKVCQEFFLPWRKTSFEGSSPASGEQFDERVHVQFD